MRLVATLAIAAGLSLAAAAPASADPQICRPIPLGGVCVDPENPRCIVAAGGTMWNACVINPLPILAPIFP